MNQINPIIVELLAKRGIRGEAEINEFLSDKPQKTYDPFLLPDMEAGVDLLLRAIHGGKKICIYGDYDADGITSVSILMEFLGTLTQKIEYYIPSRFDEGYGLNSGAIRNIFENGAEVLLTVDCGSVSYEEVELAKKLGMEVLVTDHHSITDVQADCLLINPKRQDCRYPFRELAGCGVAFKLAQAIQRRADLPRAAINRALDLVAAGTIADVVPLLDENRTLVKHGLHIIASGVRPGLNGLIEGISLHRETIRADQIAFGIAPHLNAAGRIEDAKVAVRLLLEKEPKRIRRHVEQLVSYNHRRKSLQEEAFKKCCQIIDCHLQDRKFLVVYTEDVHEGVAGIVAGKLKERYERPAILVTPSGEGLKGTGRSIKGVHLYEVLKSHEELFSRFGGHEGACGFSMPKENLPKLEAVLEEDMERLLDENPQLFSQGIEADLKLEGSQITLELAEALDRMGPFGSKNPKPRFLLEKTRISGQRPMGDGRHIRFFADCRDGARVECVLFNRAEELRAVLYGEEPVDLTGTVDFQEWKGNKKVQFTVEAVI